MEVSDVRQLGRYIIVVILRVWATTDTVMNFYAEDHVV